MILGISVDTGHTRGVLMDSNGVVLARAASPAAEPADGIAAVARETMASAGGSRPSAVGVAFPDPDSKTWPTDFSFLTAAVGETIPVRALGIGSASALAEVWYGAGDGARHLIAFSVGSCVSAGVVSNGVLLCGAQGWPARCNGWR